MRTRSGNPTRTILRNFENTPISKKADSDFLRKKRQKENITKKTKIIQPYENLQKINKFQIENGSKNFKNKKSQSKEESKKKKPVLNELKIENFDNSLKRSESNGEFFNDSYMDSLMIRPDKNLPGTGLRNLGNTCFLNSVLQCILYTTPLKNYFSLSDHSETCKSKSVCFICEYGRLSKLIHEKKSAITPQNIIENIKNIANHIKIGRQEDAHEFMLYFLSAMESSATNYVISVKKKYNKINKKQITFFEDNLIQKVFGGSLNSTVTCSKCKSNSTRSDRFLDISLDISKNESLSDCLDHFCKAEELSGMNKYYCEKCKNKNDSVKKLSFQKFPRIMVIHLKRFDNRQRKIKKFIKYDSELEFQNYGVKSKHEKSTYRLSSVLIHNGHSIYSGHYYCYVRVSDDIWYLFNDQSVERVSESVVMKQTPYILFYEKVIDRNRLKLTSKTKSLPQKVETPNRPVQKIRRRNAVTFDPNENILYKTLSESQKNLKSTVLKTSAGNQIREAKNKKSKLVTFNKYLNNIVTRRNKFTGN